MKIAIEKRANEKLTGVSSGADEAIGGYQRAASEARGGVEQNYRRELDANRGIYMSQLEAAAFTRDAGLDAAKLRQAGAVVAPVGREMSRELG